MTRKYGRNYQSTFPIYRMKDYELDVAVESLESRDYELVHRGFDVVNKKFCAVMRKVEGVGV